MINKKTVEKLLAFTLAEVLVTMIVITLITIVSIPVIKKSKEFKESNRDKSYWMSMYDKNNKLIVQTNVPGASGGTASDGTGQYAQFIPPAGVTKFNVTVVGGGGGGAAGESGLGQTKTYFPVSNATTETNDNTFAPVSDGNYQIIAIGGGGGGGGGGAIGCRGTGGWSGGVVMETAYLYKDRTYHVFAGQNASGGKGQGVLDFILGGVLPILGGITAGLFTGGMGWLVAGGLAGAAHIGGGALSAALGSMLAPKDRLYGGGRGLASAFSGEGVAIAAGGGCGGQHSRKKIGFVSFKCKKVGGCEGFNPEMSGGGVQAKPAEGRIGGSLCKMVGSKYECIIPGLASSLEGVDPSQFGSGGDGGGAMANGRDGKPGMVQIRELPIFGGGGGQPGAVSFFSYERSPLDRNSTEKFVRVYPGLGGKGEIERGDKGEDGSFSRFGTRIIADGGEGGRPRATVANEQTMRALGENGAETTVPESTLKNVKFSGARILNGGFQVINDIKNIDGHSAADVIVMPGAGGGGGGAQGSKSFDSSEVLYGVGGDGAPGAVIVTW